MACPHRKQPKAEWNHQGKLCPAYACHLQSRSLSGVLRLFCFVTYPAGRSRTTPPAPKHHGSACAAQPVLHTGELGRTERIPALGPCPGTQFNCTRFYQCGAVLPWDILLGESRFLSHRKKKEESRKAVRK